jgi:hypothetical protein
MEKISEKVETCLRRIILTFGVLIGFCWEHAFSEGIGIIAGRVHNITHLNTEVLKLIGCSTVALVVLPAFRLYIVPKVFKLKDEQKKRA